MIFALGACVAGLLALLCLPAISRRAMRFAHAAVERQMPISIDEIVAQRDLLRAEFATERRQLEQAMEKVREAHAAEVIQSGRRAAQVGRLSEELSAVTVARDIAEAARKSAERFAHETATENGALQKALYDADGMEARLRDALGALSRDHAALTHKHEALEHVHAEMSIALADLQAAYAEREKTRATLEAAYEQLKLDTSVMRAHAETQAAQIDAHEEAMRVALATESGLRKKVSELESGVASPDDIAALRRTIVEIGREVVRLADERGSVAADASARAPAPATSVH